MDWTISCNWLDKFYKCDSIGMQTFFRNYIEPGHFQIATSTNSFEIVMSTIKDILINYIWIITKSTIWSHCNEKLEIHLKVVMGGMYKLEYCFSNIKLTSTNSSSGNQIQTAYFWLRTSRYCTSNLVGPFYY